MPIFAEINGFDMYKMLTTILSAALLLSCGMQGALKPWDKGAFESGRYRNLFVEAGHSEAEVEARLREVFHEVFYGPDKVYFELGDSLGYISDIKNNDVRTEGMSYGMMIAVQFDRQDIFDRIWRWSKKYMQHRDGPLKGYFAWSCKTDGTRNSQGPASDGELYYVTALLFASNLWGDDGGIDYKAEAGNILDCAMEKDGSGGVMPFINKEHRLITFTPDSWGSTYTDPSYHVPAFYEIWARYADDGRADFWLECASASREYLHKAINATTGLNPDQSNYDGSLIDRGPWGMGARCFRYDSWRVPMNITLDYEWSCADAEWQGNYAKTVQDFFYSKGMNDFADQYRVDGSEPSESEILPAGGWTKVLRHSVGLVATLGTTAIMNPDARGLEFAEALWNSQNVPYPDGYFDAYYDGLLRLFAFMHLSGRYRVITGD